MKIKIQTDGAAKGNPGVIGIGVVILENDEVIMKVSENVGKGTNNEAEYLAAIRGLEEALKLKAEEVVLITDSQLLMKQLNGYYGVKALNLVGYFNKVVNLSEKFKNFSVVWMPRNKNFFANALASKAAKPDKCEIKKVKASRQYKCKGCGKVIKQGEICKLKVMWYPNGMLPVTRRFHFDCLKSG